jgi:hypothetical protein
MRRSKTQLTPAILQAALHGLEIQRNTLDEQIGQVNLLLGRRAPGRTPRSTGRDSEQTTQPKRSPLSAAARRRISAAQRKRWAAVRAEGRSQGKSASAAKKSKI